MPPWYVGIDAGGTRTRLHAAGADGPVLHTQTGPAAHLRRQGVEAVAETLAALLREVPAAHPGVQLETVCAGVAGGGDPADTEALAAQLRQVLGAATPARLHVVHDAEIALEAAFSGESGVIVIAGTGSIIYARGETGATHRAGGWGYLLGDEGSGFTLGRLGLQAVAAAFDGGPPTRLRTLLARRHGLATPEALRRRVYREGWALQHAAPLVLEAAAGGDAVARRILTEQTHALARQVGYLARRAEAVTPRVALLGGLSEEAPYQEAFAEALARVLPAWPLQKPDGPPVEGALRLARRL